MSMYDLLADRYSEIFPLEPAKIDFIKTICPSSKAKILDAGCATGDLAIELERHGYTVSGIDTNARMIDIARKKAAGNDQAVDFRVMDIRDIAVFRAADCVACFGNTLPHLPSEMDVHDFFFAASSIIPSDGAFIVQILNYDLILEKKDAAFRTIESDAFSFRRSYEFLDDGYISFTVEIEDKSAKQLYSDSTRLLPLKRETILAALRDASFSCIDIYSDYAMTKSDSQEFSTIYVGRKKITDEPERT